MSKSLQIADAMAARLNAHLTLGNVSTVVDRQKDIASEINKRVLKAGGAVIVILFEGFTNASGAVSGQTSVTRRYTVSIYSKPVLRDGETPADDIVELVAKILHNWDIDETTTQAAEITVTGCDMLPDRNYLIYTLDVECASRL